MASGAAATSPVVTPCARINIIVDERERKGAIPHMEAAVEQNNEQYKTHSIREGGGYIDYCVKTIATGDYAWIKPGGGVGAAGAAPITIAVAERKTWADMAATITDGRGPTQHEALMALRKKGIYVFYIIEGPLKYAEGAMIKRIDFATLQTKLRRNMLRGIPYVQCANEVETAKFIVNFARDILVVNGKREKAEDDEFMRQLLALCGENADHEVAQYLLGLFGDRTPVGDGQVVIGGDQTTTDSGELTTAATQATVDVVPADIKHRPKASDLVIIESVWTCFPGISSRTAPIIRSAMTINEYFTLPYDVVFKRISELRYASESLFGVKRADKIAVAAYVGDSLFKIAARDAAQVAILGGINGVSVDCAKLVLKVYSLGQIAKGEVTVKQLAEIPISGRKLGPKKAQTIAHIFGPPVATQ